MLVLTRGKDEEIVIRLEDGRELVVRVVEFRRGGGKSRVRLGVFAPPTIQVDRREVREAKDAGTPVKVEE